METGETDILWEMVTGRGTERLPEDSGYLLRIRRKAWLAIDLSSDSACQPHRNRRRYRLCLDTDSRHTYIFYPMDPEHINREWHAMLRRRDSDDIVTGRRTPAEVNRDNAWIPNPQEWEIRNLSQATRALRRQR